MRKITESGAKVERIGEERIMNCGLSAKIIAYNNRRDITLRFADGSIRDNVEYKDFCKGKVLPIKRKRCDDGESRLNEECRMNCGLMARIIAYRTAKDIDVLFEDGSIREHVEYVHFVDGEVKHPKINNKFSSDDFYGYIISMPFKVNEKIIYRAENIETKKRKLLTLQEILKSSHDCFEL